MRSVIQKLTLLLFPAMFATGGYAQSPDAFTGMWALSIGYPTSNAGWMEIRFDKGYLDASVLWRWASVELMEFAFIADDQLFIVNGKDVVRERDRAGNPVRIQHPVYWMQVRKTGEDQISGTAHFPEENGIGVEEASFTGKRIPPFTETPDPTKAKYGKPVKLFNGKDLTGWELMEKGATSGWRVEGGALVNNAVQAEGADHVSYGNLRTVATFNDFNLKLQVNVPEGSNSGVYLRGLYEIQVLDSYGQPLDPHNMGALYSRITPMVSAEKPAGTWQDLDITLYKRYLTVILNGNTIIDNQPVKGVTGGAISPDESKPGPIFLQGDHGAVSYRNIVLIPIVE